MSVCAGGNQGDLGVISTSDKGHKRMAEVFDTVLRAPYGTLHSAGGTPVG